MLESRDRPKTRIACPICATTSRPAVRVGAATYHECPVCETLFQHPMPTIDAMRDYVDGEYASGVYNDYVAAAKLKSLTFRVRVNEIRKRIDGGRLLDVGASCGFFVEEALEGGFDAYGVELSAEAISKAPQSVRPRLSLGDVNSLDLSSPNVFDVVTAFDLIEHVFEPVDFLRQLHRVVRPGSWIVISTPDVGHVLRHVLRSSWPMFQPMQHTVLFSKRGLTLALTTAGFTDIRIGPAHKTLTADYLAGQVDMYVPQAVRIYKSVAKLVPQSARNRPINVNIGELMAFARVPDANGSRL